MPPEERYPLLRQYNLENSCHHLDAAKLCTQNAGRVSRPKIQRVPGYMGARAEFEKFYLPKLIAVGPIHQGKPYVELGERYKSMWISVYLNYTNQSAYDLCETILRHIVELREQFSDDVLKKDDSNAHVAELLLRDGCSVLLVLNKSYRSVDPELELGVSIDHLVRVHDDLLLLENQIPFKVLKLLCNDKVMLTSCLNNFLRNHGIKRNPIGVPEDGQDQPIHLLDYLRRALLERDQIQITMERKIIQRSLHFRKYRIGSVRELKAAGIHVKKHTNINSFYPDFKDGKLCLPKFSVDGSTNIIILNLIAYEMCQDFRNNFEISSCIVFLSSLIDQPEDVKELRSVGILDNGLANDKEVADLFNRMNTVLVPETESFTRVRDLMKAHFESKRCKIKVLSWMREVSHTHFRSPWTIIALLAAALGLALTFIQTWYAIHPKE